MKLDLGCSDSIPPKGFTGVDRCPPADEIVDLNAAWPWEDSSIDEIRAVDIIEHLSDQIHTMNEAHRVLKPDGLLHIEVPTIDGPGAWQDPTHKSFWHRNSFRYFEYRNYYRNRFAAAYGITAVFVIRNASVDNGSDGPVLTIDLIAGKAK